jgi:hypothetical protein
METTSVCHFRFNTNMADVWTLRWELLTFSGVGSNIFTIPFCPSEIKHSALTKQQVAAV